MSTFQDLRPSPIAGTWYEGNPQTLARQVDEYLFGVQTTEIGGEILAVITPHAGHIYSGRVAGYAFAAIRDFHPDTVVVVSPMHQPYPQPLLTSAHEAFHTPLGDVPVDHTLIHELNSMLKMADSQTIQAVRLDREHSIEIELPFLQRIYRYDFKLVPIMVRDQTPRATKALGQAMYQCLADKKVMVVASTDLSHFYPESVARELDSRMLSKWETLSIPGIYQLDDTGTGFACGLGAVAAVMEYACLNGAKRSVILNYATSADITGDESSVVGYASAAIIK